MLQEIQIDGFDPTVGGVDDYCDTDCSYYIRQLLDDLILYCQGGVDVRVDLLKPCSIRILNFFSATS